LQGRVKPYSVDCKPSNKGPLEVLVLDTCSVVNWADYFHEWKSDGGTVIDLTSSDSQNGNTPSTCCIFLLSQDSSCVLLILY
jgi:hypothetical protein